MRMEKETRAFIEALALEAGALLKERLHKRHTVEYKGEINLVTEADRLAETLIVERIGRSYPGHDILTEESPETANGSGFRWIIDPLDGTTNYAHGFPVFCVSIALEVEGVIQLGTVYNPMLEEMFTAERGKGAFLNGARLTVSRTTDLNKALLATGFPYDLRQDRNNNMNYFRELAMSVQAVRRAGSAALDLAYVASGRLDGFWEFGVFPWDIAAGSLLISEAGGLISDLSGGDNYLKTGNLIAGTPKVFSQILQVIDSHRTPALEA